MPHTVDKPENEMFNRDPLWPVNVERLVKSYPFRGNLALILTGITFPPIQMLLEDPDSQKTWTRDTLIMWLKRLHVDTNYTSLI